MVKKFIIFLLIFLPSASLTIFIPWVNQIEPILFGLPFLHFWLFLWILLSPVCVWAVYHLQKSQGGIE
ncbi:DUF3311 domain-containing protein [Brevibacillus fulvus]|uniref:DUF3311 domain-containing protein n=1 Tax=Brevibacillus fulvus TaxID=1125967 RepID=A0A938Y0G9_9BACL|nr:DUF3311 domain-containing protein [Brevibacillus fulvus]MBM7589776.1 hypothetical protein [Brevibacillus fulvus]